MHLQNFNLVQGNLLPIYPYIYRAMLLWFVHYILVTSTYLEDRARQYNNGRRSIAPRDRVKETNQDSFLCQAQASNWNGEANILISIVLVIIDYLRIRSTLKKPGGPVS